RRAAAYLPGECPGDAKRLGTGSSLTHRWRRDHRAKYGCLSARPRVRCFCPPGKTQHLLPKSGFDRPRTDRWNLASTTFPDAGPMVRIRFPPDCEPVRAGGIALGIAHDDQVGAAGRTSNSAMDVV